VIDFMEKTSYIASKKIMKTYYIYHIQGVKIGCTDNLKRRLRSQKYTEYEILEEHMDIDVAAAREIELQKQYGYKTDKVKYNQYDYSKNGKIAGKKAVESGQLASIRSKGGKVGGKIVGKITGKIVGRKNVESGKIYEAQKKAAEARSIPISAYRKDTGQYVGTYPSQSECARQLNITNINACLNGSRSHIRGYTFRIEVK